MLLLILPFLDNRECMSTASSTAAPRNAWIVSPAWDLAYLVATPLVIVPAVLLLARHWFTPEQITLAVISFASMGHHLPGFMRAYGDSDLFARFRLRFLVMPVAIFSLAVLFSPPSWLAEPLGLTWQHLHGLELILLLWGTWHGLMQTYGFMRIYDLKRGIRDRWTARLDHWLCLAVFGCGYLFSDARMYGTAEVMWQIGLPVFGREVLQAIRAAAAIAAALVLCLYTLHAWRAHRYGDGLSGNKLLLAASTGWIYWYSGRLSTNLIIGLAMFEIYHAIQYYAIVWFYNRRAVERGGARFGWLGFLFRDRWTMLGLYLALIAAFGSIRFFTVDTADYVFRGGELDAHKLLIAFFVTSTFLHFYFDGFIWKVRDGRTQQNLVGDQGPSVAMRMVPALAHAGKWSIFFAAAFSFLVLEYRARVRSSEDRSYVNELAALTPSLPELQVQLSRDALDHGDTERAIELAQAALAQRPRSHAAHGDLAVAWMAAGEYKKALPLLKQAAALKPSDWRHHTNLGRVYDALDRPVEAEEAFRRAVAVGSNDPTPHRRLADWLLERGRPREAEEQYARCLSLGGSGFVVRLHTVHSLLEAREWQRAHTLARELCKRYPRSADAHVALGAALLGDGKMATAADAFRRAIDLQADHAPAWLQLGSALYAEGDLESAQQALETALRHNPGHAETLANLGAVLLARGELTEAESRLRQALAADRSLAAARLNLAAALLRQGWTAAAAEQIEEARAAGAKPPPELLRELRLARTDAN